MKTKVLIALCLLIIPTTAAHAGSWKCDTAWFWILKTGGQGCK